MRSQDGGVSGVTVDANFAECQAWSYLDSQVMVLVNRLPLNTTIYHSPSPIRAQSPVYTPTILASELQASLVFSLVDTRMH